MLFSSVLLLDVVLNSLDNRYSSLSWSKTAEVFFFFWGLWGHHWCSDLVHSAGPNHLWGYTEALGSPNPQLPFLPKKGNIKPSATHQPPLLQDLFPFITDVLGS